MSEKLLLQYCPECRAGLNASTEALGNNAAEPKPGDLAVCFYCGTILHFDGSGVLVRATRADIGKLSPEDAFTLGGIVGAIQKRNREKTGEL